MSLSPISNAASKFNRRRGGALPAYAAPGARALLLMLLTLALPALLGGCGYGFTASEPTIIGDASKTMKLIGVEQPTLYSWMGQIVRSQLRDEIGARRVAAWVDSGSADYNIQLNIISFTMREYVSNRKDNTLIFNGTLEIQAIVYEGVGNTEIWRSGVVSYSDNYETYYERDAAEQLSRQAVNLLVSHMRHKF